MSTSAARPEACATRTGTPRDGTGSRSSGLGERCPQGRSLVIIKAAVNDDWPRIWPFYAQIVLAGEMYAYPDLPTFETARSLWMEEPPGQTGW
jgi:hypothetical protein